MRAFCVCVAALIFIPSLARGAIVYETAGDESTNDEISGAGLQSFGDDITLGGTARQITSITIPFLVQNFPDVDGGAASPYTPNLTLTLYKNDGTVTSASDSIDSGDTAIGGITRPSTVIATSSITGPAFGTSTPYNTSVSLTFNFANVLVPSMFSFAVQQTNYDPNNNGANLFSIDLSDIGGALNHVAHPLIIGSHNTGILWLQNVSNNQFEASNLESNFGGPAYLGVEVTVNAVPEPGTLMLVVAGVVSCLFLRIRKRSPKLI